MNQDRDIVIATINKAKDEIMKIKEDIKNNKTNVEGIKEIKIKLSKLEDSLVPKQKWFNEKEDTLDSLLEELLNIRYKIILKSKDEMFSNININLLDGMSLKFTNEDERDIIFANAKVGKIIVIKEYDPYIKIKVHIYDSIDEFDVDEPRKMFNIVSFINTNFNYKKN